MKLEKQSKSGACPSLVAILFVLSGFLTVGSWAAEEINFDKNDCFASDRAIYLQWSVDGIDQSKIKRFYVTVVGTTDTKSIPFDTNYFIHWDRVPDTEYKYTVTVVFGVDALISGQLKIKTAKSPDRRGKILDPKNKEKPCVGCQPKKPRRPQRFSVISVGEAVLLDAAAEESPEAEKKP